MATIRDVAKDAGVSIATVSRVLSGDKFFRVKDSTRKNIMDSVQKLNYKIPISETTRLHFGCVLADTTYKYGDPFFMEILQAMEEECESNNMMISINKSYQELEDPHHLQEFLNSDLSGVFLMEHVSPTVMTALKAHIPHIIFIDNDEPEYVFNNVGFDHTTANWQVMNYLLSKGYRRIGIISGGSQKVSLDGSLRIIAYREMLRQSNIKFDPSLVKDCKWDLDICKRQTEELMSMQNPPDAIFAGSDSLASVVLGTLYSMGYRCPKDVGVIGFNNIDLSSHMVPPLTTVEVPTEDIGRAAIKRMHQLVNGDDTSIMRILFPTKIIERKSLR